MVKSIGRVLAFALLLVNIFMALLFVLCCYSPLINPLKHPVLSCAGLAFPIFFFIVLAFLFFWLISYKRYSLVSIVTLLICLKPILTYTPFNISSSEIPYDSIKLLSYNTMAFNEGKIDENGKNSILEYIKNSDADIVCIQEFIPGGKLSLKKIEKELSEYKYSHYYKIPDAFNGLGIFSRFPIISAEPIDYESRSNGSIAYKLKVKGDTLVVVNNHFESNKITENDKSIYREMIKDPNKGKVSHGSRLLINKLANASKIRAAQADSVAKYISKHINYPIIVCGDFNDSPLSYTHHAIEEYLKDAFVDSGLGPGISYNQNFFFFRIDHILVSRYMKTKGCTVDRTIKDSDHYPIWCYIGI